MSGGGGSGARSTTGRGRATASQAAGHTPAGTSSSSSAQLPPTHLPSGEPIAIGEQLMQVDQAITLALQEIDANFAQTHQTITSRILPAIKRYGMASHNTWQGVRFWHHFFETASDIRLAPMQTEETEEDVREGKEASAESADGQMALAHDAGRDAFDESSRRTKALSSEERVAHDSDSSYDQQRMDTTIASPQPPRVSDASLAATARLGKARMPENEEMESRANRSSLHGSHQMRSTLHRTSASNLAKDVLREQHKSAIGRLHATPRRASEATNPFTGQSTDGTRQQRVSSNWNGIADLRKTPLAVSKQGGKTSRSDIDVGDDSLAWPPGMSPPVTVQFSVPRSRYTKTPAKEAAKMVVDDLLRTVDGTNSATRRRLVQERDSRRGSRGGESNRANALAGPSTTPSGLVGTPLRKAGNRKPRTSMPTPPTITKRRPAEATLRLGMPKAGGAPEPPGSAASSARLLDDGEGGEVDGEVDASIGPDLGTGLGRLALSPKNPSSSLDVMFDSSRNADDDDSDSDDFDSDESNEEIVDDEVHLGSSSAVVGTSYPTSATRQGSWNGKQTGAMAHSSMSHSIDEDTLFGIKDPSAGSAGKVFRQRVSSAISPAASRSAAARKSGAGPSAKSADRHISLGSSRPSASMQSAKAGISDAQSHKGQQSRASTTTKTPMSRLASTNQASSQAYRPLGRVDALGTVHRGRPLVSERRDDHTYSMPSPTPMGTQNQHQRRIP